MCAVCDEKLNPRTPLIACTSCQNYIHLEKCAGFSFRKAKKLNGKFTWSKCTVNEIQPDINYENLKQRKLNVVVLLPGFVAESYVKLIF